MRIIFWILIGFTLNIIFQTCTSSSNQENTNQVQNPSREEEQQIAENTNESDIVKKGREIAEASFEALSGELKTALQRGGVPEAIQYCNLNANPLTDSLSNVYNVKIQRIGTRTRNPKNIPNNSFEHGMLKRFRESLKKGEKPKLERELLYHKYKDDVVFYMPITIQATCLNCHGEVGKDISEENYQLIQKFYPQDEAINYQLGDLRGAWRIEFKR